MMDLYREEVLDHAKNPRNWGKLKNPSVEVRETNPLCGDEVVLDIILDGDKVAKVGFEGAGCAISIASSSMLTEKILGKARKELEKLDEKGILSWFGGSLTSSRRDCALLPMKALTRTLGGGEK